MYYNLAFVCRRSIIELVYYRNNNPDANATPRERVYAGPIKRQTKYTRPIVELFSFFLLQCYIAILSPISELAASRPASLISPSVSLRVYLQPCPISLPHLMPSPHDSFLSPRSPPDPHVYTVHLYVYLSESLTYSLLNPAAARARPMQITR